MPSGAESGIVWLSAGVGRRWEEVGGMMARYRERIAAVSGGEWDGGGGGTNSDPAIQRCGNTGRGTVQCERLDGCPIMMAGRRRVQLKVPETTWAGRFWAPARQIDREAGEETNATIKGTAPG